MSKRRHKSSSTRQSPPDLQRIREESATILERLLRQIPPELLESLRTAGPQVLAKAGGKGLTCAIMVARADFPEKKLTPREREIAALVGQGLSNKAIAEKLGISPRTVGVHVRRIFDKLDVHSRAALAHQSILLS